MRTTLSCVCSYCSWHGTQREAAGCACSRSKGNVVAAIDAFAVLAARDPLLGRRDLTQLVDVALLLGHDHRVTDALLAQLAEILDLGARLLDGRFRQPRPARFHLP
jgi:hypothetical protein